MLLWVSALSRTFSQQFRMQVDNGGKEVVKKKKFEMKKRNKTERKEIRREKKNIDRERKAAFTAFLGCCG